MNIEDLSRFKTDLQMMFGVLKCRQDRTKMLEYVNKNEAYFSSVDIETAYAMEAMLKSKAIVKSIKKEQGEVCDMCKALDDLYNDGVEEGELKNSKKIIKEFLSEHSDISQDLDERIGGESDLEVLRKWIKLSARVSSIEEFEVMMDKA